MGANLPASILNQIATSGHFIVFLSEKAWNVSNADPLFGPAIQTAIASDLRIIPLFLETFNPSSYQSQSSETNPLTQVLRFHGIGLNDSDFDQAMEQLRGTLLKNSEPDLEQLAERYHNQGDFEQARQLLDQSIALKLRANPEDPSLAETYYNAAMVCIKQGRYEQANAALQASLVRYTNELGKDDVRLGKPLAALANVAFLTADFSRAEEYVIQALNIYERGYQPDHPALLDPLTTLGQISASQGRRPEALAAYSRALAIAEKALAPEDSRTIQIRKLLTQIDQAPA